MNSIREIHINLKELKLLGFIGNSPDKDRVLYHQQKGLGIDNKETVVKD